MRAQQVTLLTGILNIHLPTLKCPESMDMQPKHNDVCHGLRWVTFVAHHSLVGTCGYHYKQVCVLPNLKGMYGFQWRPTPMLS